MFGSILPRFGLDESEYSVKAFGNGLINHTWKIISAGKEYLLQRINKNVFQHPEDIMDNCRQLADYFKLNHPDYLFVHPLPSTDHRNFVLDEEKNYYRLFPFIKNSHTYNTLTNPAFAFEAARQFGKFTRLLSGFDPSILKTTLPDFHNLSLRFRFFEEALRNGSQARIEKSTESISFLKSQRTIVDIFEKTQGTPAFKQRVIHHDAKINNVLFDIGTNEGICIIDLDTVMTGFYISDVGDMLRTYISPAAEEEADFSLIEIREEYFLEIARGYLGEMQSELSETEMQYFIYAGKFAIYMQALRFLTDYLHMDRYYLTQYPDQNFIRAGNQIVLLNRFMEKENRMHELMKSF